MVVVGLAMIEELGEFGTGYDAVAGLVKIDTHDITAAGLHVNALFTEWNKQVLGRESPVKKGTYLVHRFYAQEGKITHYSLGRFGGSHRPVLTIVIHKHADHVTYLHFRCDVALGQQHFMGIIIYQIGTEIDCSVNAQLVIFANLHIKSVYFFAKFGKKIDFSTWF